MKPVNAFLLLLIFSGVSCKTPKYHVFSLRNSDWKNSGELRAKGYYFTDLNDAEGALSKKILPHYYEIYMLFQDGTFCRLNQFFSSHEQVRYYLRAHESDLGLNNKYAYWGRYIVRDERIVIEYFFPDPHGFSLGVYKLTGIVRSDYCFIIDTGFMVNDDPKRTSKIVYKYEFTALQKELSSQNLMMKKRWFKIAN